MEADYMSLPEFLAEAGFSRQWLYELRAMGWEPPMRLRKRRVVLPRTAAMVWLNGYRRVKPPSNNKRASFQEAAA